MVVLSFEQILTLAVMVETVVTLFWSLYKKDDKEKWYKNIQWKLLFSMVVGELIAFLFNADMTTVLNLPSPVFPWVGVALTGLVFGRGANFVHDIFGFVKALKEGQQVTVKAIAAKVIDNPASSSEVRDLTD